MSNVTVDSAVVRRARVVEAGENKRDRARFELFRLRGEQVVRLARAQYVKDHPTSWTDAGIEAAGRAAAQAYDARCGSPRESAIRPDYCVAGASDLRLDAEVALDSVAHLRARGFRGSIAPALNADRGHGRVGRYRHYLIDVAPWPEPVRHDVACERTAAPRTPVDELPGVLGTPEERRLRMSGWASALRAMTARRMEPSVPGDDRRTLHFPSERDELLSDYLDTLWAVKGERELCPYDPELDADPKARSAFREGDEQPSELTEEEEMLLSECLAAEGLDPNSDEPWSLADRRAYARGVEEFRQQLGDGLWHRRRFDPERLAVSLRRRIEQVRGELRATRDAAESRQLLALLDVLKRASTDPGALVEWRAKRVRFTMRDGSRGEKLVQTPALVTFREDDRRADQHDALDLLAPDPRPMHRRAVVEELYEQFLAHQALAVEDGRRDDMDRYALLERIPPDADHESENMAAADRWSELHHPFFDSGRVCLPAQDRALRQHPRMVGRPAKRKPRLAA